MCAIVNELEKISCTAFLIDSLKYIEILLFYFIRRKTKGKKKLLYFTRSQCLNSYGIIFFFYSLTISYFFLQFYALIHFIGSIKNSIKNNNTATRMASTTSVKCVLCKKAFSDKTDITNHFVTEHNVPREDDVLKRYVKLRFSKNLNTGDVEGRFRMIITLGKLLKNRGALHTINREKVLVNTTRVEKVLYEFMEHQDEIDSLNSGTSNSNVFKLIMIEWFMAYFDVFINRNVNSDDALKSGSGVSFGKHSVRFRSDFKCARLKIELKENVDMDFTDVEYLPGGSDDPFETFTMIQKVLYGDFFTKINKRNEDSFQLLIEMSVEFVRHNNQIEQEHWENDSDFYTGNSDCAEQRSIKEYSVLSEGAIYVSDMIYNEAMSSMSRKVTNSFNVIGSNWSLRRIISSNTSILYNSNAEVFAPRLVKGKTSAADESAGEKEIVLTEYEKRFVEFFSSCYQTMQENQRQSNRNHKKLKALLATHQRVKIVNPIANLTEEDKKTILGFAKQWGAKMFENVSPSPPPATPELKKVNIFF